MSQIVREKQFRVRLEVQKPDGWIRDKMARWKKVTRMSDNMSRFWSVKMSLTGE